MSDIDLFSNIMESWFGGAGDYTVIALLIMAFFVLVLVIVGLDFKYALLFTIPLAVAFSPETGSGWLAPWVAVTYWILVVGYGGFLVWTLISER